MSVSPAEDDSPLAAIVSRQGRKFRTVGDMVYGVLREGILTGALEPGEWLRQDALAAQLGVSRIPIRSALLQLETEGLIRVDPYRGATVIELSTDEMREIYELRRVLETHALRKAVDHMTPERIAHLDAMARELNVVTDGEEFLAKRVEFYRELYDDTLQPQTVALIEKLRSDAGRYWLQRKIAYVSQPGSRDHMEIVAFVKAHDVEGAVQWLEHHLTELGTQLIELMEKDG
jgi:DNA-binding GntR family transcriptional regulator